MWQASHTSITRFRNIGTCNSSRQFTTHPQPYVTIHALHWQYITHRLVIHTAYGEFHTIRWQLLQRNCSMDWRRLQLHVSINVVAHTIRDPACKAPPAPLLAIPMRVSSRVALAPPGNTRSATVRLSMAHEARVGAQ
jgi:hypothetical protein